LTKLSYKIGFWIVLILSISAITAFSYKYSYFVNEKLLIVQNIIMNDGSNEDGIGYNYLPSYYQENLQTYRYIHNTTNQPFSIITPTHLYNDTLQSFEMPSLNTMAELRKWESTCNIDEFKKSKVTIKNIEHIPPQPAILQSSTIHDDYIMNNYTMKFLFDQEQIVFYELLPNDDQDTYNAAFVLPGSGHQGARDILGIPSEYSYDYYHDEIGKRIVEEGIAVYVIELRGTGTRQINADKVCPELDDTCSTSVLENRLSGIGISLTHLQEAEITQLLAWIESREYVDNIATVGLSKGSVLASHQALLHPDVIDAVVMASGPSPTENAPLNKQSGKACIIEEEYTCLGLTYIGNIAPMPAYVSFGTQETELFRYEAEMNNVEKYMSQVYDIHNASEDFTYVIHDGRHQYDIPTVLEFLKKHLNTKHDS
jgi:hypothetical protein